MPLAVPPFPQPARDTDGHWRTVVPGRFCVGGRGQTFLFGGCVLAAGIAVLEEVSGQPVIFAQAQFAGAAREGDEIVFSANPLSDGRTIRQFAVQATIDGRLFASLQGAAGQRVDATRYLSSTMPPVRPAQDCSERSVARLLSSNVNDLLEVRLASGELPDRADWGGGGGLDLACWMAFRKRVNLSRPALAVVADCASLAPGTSLDNTIRFVSDCNDSVVLAAFHVDSVADGIAHVTTRLHAPSGVLVAIAQQTMVLRPGLPGSNKA